MALCFLITAQVVALLLCNVAVYLIVSNSRVHDVGGDGMQMVQHCRLSIFHARIIIGSNKQLTQHMHAYNPLPPA